MSEQHTPIRRPFDAVIEDENRRAETLSKLTKAIEGYLGSCSREREVQWDRVRELISTACRDFYDSLATSYLAVEPAVNPEHLFGISGELFGGCTLVDFENAIKQRTIRTPEHWPPPQMWREGDSPEQVLAFTDISRDLHRDLRLGAYLEDGLLQERVAEGVRHWRPQFDRRFADSKKASVNGGREVSMSNPFRDGFKEDNFYLQTDKERTLREKERRSLDEEAQSIIRERDEHVATEQKQRAKARCEWLDKNISALKWDSDLDIQAHQGPTYNTIQRYRSGKTSTRDQYVRGKLAKAFRCKIDEVPL